MKIKALIGIEGYSLMVCHCSGKLYHISVINKEKVIHNFEGIYSSLDNAINRGRSVIENLKYSKYI